jgi:hypothetical protein
LFVGIRKRGLSGKLIIDEMVRRGSGLPDLENYKQFWRTLPRGISRKSQKLSVLNFDSKEV